MLSKQVFVYNKSLCKIYQINTNTSYAAKELKIKISNGHCPYIKNKGEISVKYLRLHLCC